MNVKKQRLQEAVQFHRAGRISEAEALYRQILSSDPGNADALHLLGTVEHQKGHLEAAERLIRSAIRRDGGAHFFHLNLGNTLREQGKVDEAIACYRKSISLNARSAEAHVNLGNELCRCGDYGEAIGHYQEAVRWRPDLAEAHYNLGKALMLSGTPAEAVGCFGRALELRPHYPEAHFNLGVIRHDAQQHREAIAHYALALKIRPDYADAHYNLGSVLMETERYREAEGYFRRAIALRPDFAAALRNLGVVLRKQGQTAGAIECARRAVELAAGNADGHNNLGVALRDDGRIGEAIACCGRAIALQPDFADAHWNLGLALLQSGDMTRGWEKYEWRAHRRKVVLRRLPLPRWDGSPLPDATLLVYAEQGIGDQIMFGSLFGEASRFVRSCIVECDERLVPLFARSFPALQVVPLISDVSRGPLPDADAAIPMGSLPLYLRPDLASFPRQQAYLKPDPAGVALWRQRYAELGDGLKIGISWRGGKAASVRHLRSTVLTDWQPLFALRGMHFINLQYGDCAGELSAAAQSGMKIHHWDDADPLVDLDGFAAQVAALDLVVSVDNSTVHMAGALGIPTWALLPRGCDWRWLCDVEDTPWYASLRLFRQKEHLEWTELFARVAAEMEAAGGAVAQTIPSIRSYRSIVPPCRPLPADVANDSPVAGDAAGERETYMKAWALDDRTYAHCSPGLELSKSVRFLEFFREHGVTSVLDAGIGSGKLCRKMMEMGFSCHGVDIADNCLDPDLAPLKESLLTVGCLWDGGLFSEGAFDAVVCTDVLEHIPTARVEEVLANLFRWAGRYVFLQIALYHDVFGARLGRPLHLTVQPKTWWDERVSALRVLQGLELKNSAGQEVYAVYLLEKPR